MPNIVDKIISEEKKVTGSESPIGSEWNTNSYPQGVEDGNDLPWTFVTINVRDTHYSYDEIEPVTKEVANTKKEFNTIIKKEARAQGTIIGQKVVDTLGSPRFKATVELTHGNVGSYNMGDLVTVIDPSVGWWGTTQDPGKKLRVHDVNHSFGDDWTTTLQLEEDEESVKALYPTE